MGRMAGKHAGSIFAAVLAVAVLTACGSADNMSAGTDKAPADTAMYDSGGGIYTNETVAAAEYEGMEAAEEEAGVDTPEVTESAASDRKLIKDVNLSVETEQFDSLLPTVEQRVADLGGYIEEMSSYSRNNEYDPGFRGTRYFRYANITARIPRENLETFLEEIGERSNVVSRSESVTDVTLQYVDLESHKKALLTEQERLLQLMEQAETVEDIIAIEGRLSEVRYQLESMEAQLRTYDNKIDYSTVYLNIDEVEHYSPAEGASTGERIRNGFLESVEGVGRGFQNFAIWFVINLPYIFVWAIVIVAVVLVVRAVVRRNAKKNEGKRGHRNVNPYIQSADWINQTNSQVRAPAANRNENRTESRDNEQEKSGDKENV